MHAFHYNFIKKKINAELLFTDTDSLTYEIISENVYEKFFKWKDLFEFSNYSKFFNETNQKVIGKMKDEFGGIIMTEFVGLESKMCSVKINKKIIRHKVRRIQSKKHKLGTYEIDKISLSCFDDKRYVLDDGIYTLSYFHLNSVTNCNN